MPKLDREQAISVAALALLAVAMRECAGAVVTGAL